MKKKDKYRYSKSEKKIFKKDFENKEERKKNI